MSYHYCTLTNSIIIYPSELCHIADISAFYNPDVFLALSDGLIFQIYLIPCCGPYNNVIRFPTFLSLVLPHTKLVRLLRWFHSTLYVS